MPLRVLLTFMIAAALAPAAHAQIGYFGQNKVQYRTFKFQVLKTDPAAGVIARAGGRVPVARTPFTEVSRRGREGAENAE